MHEYSTVNFYLMIYLGDTLQLTELGLLLDIFNLLKVLLPVFTFNIIVHLVI